jgi:hypothetical protein
MFYANKQHILHTYGGVCRKGNEKVLSQSCPVLDRRTWWKSPRITAVAGETTATERDNDVVQKCCFRVTLELAKAAPAKGPVLRVLP